VSSYNTATVDHLLLFFSPYRSINIPMFVLSQDNAYHLKIASLVFHNRYFPIGFAFIIRFWSQIIHRTKVWAFTEEVSSYSTAKP